MDEPNHPSLKKYQKDYTKKWSETIDAADAFVIVLAEYNFRFPAGEMESSSIYTISKFASGGSGSLASTMLQRIMATGTDYNAILQTDYVNPISEKVKLEAGLRGAIRGRENNNANYFFDNNVDDYKLIPSTTGNYKNTDKVYAAYASITSSVKNFGYKIGLRAESSSYTGELTNTGETFSNKYPISLFPSLFVSQKLDDKQEVQASFTRRINRPNFFQLIPFADYTDELNITQGNPGLKPEFTSSMEGSYARSFKKNNNVLASFYYKNTDNLITRYLQPGTNPFTGKAAIIIRISTQTQAGHTAVSLHLKTIYPSGGT